MDPQISKTAGIELLRKRIDEVADLERDAINRGAVAAARKKDDFYLRCQLLDGDIRHAIDLTFGSDRVESGFYREGLPEFAVIYEAYIKSGFIIEDAEHISSAINLFESPRVPLIEFFGDNFLVARRKLNHAVKRLEESMAADRSPDSPQAVRAMDADIAGSPLRRAFIVHGHDDAARHAVAQFLERSGFEVIILQERANEGRTVIEKFELNSDVGFAVILMTPDDVGGKDAGKLRARARQNVVFELGYFIGRLGRKRVMALRKGDIEFPSDFLGVVCEPIDEHGGWKLRLANELVSAGFEIDWKKAMS